jgi:protein-L-isoaspartate(D-aspartate) O-methyltransferase
MVFFLKKGVVLKLVVVVTISLCSTFVYCQDNFAKLRENMVKEQLMARDINDPATLKAMQLVPRHEFVPSEMKPYSYSDGPLSIGMGQTISQPYIVAYMTQVLKLQKQDRVLEVGTGSGYQAAILAQLVDSVYSIEIIPELSHKAKNTLSALGYENIVLKIGDGYIGWPEKGPFDAIIVTAGAEEVPEPLQNQLREGGRMIIPVGPHKGIRQLLLISKKSGKIKSKEVMAVRFVPLVRPNN